jgi:anthrone oxygenase-like protein
LTPAIGANDIRVEAMVSLIGQLTLVCGALFTGAAVYVFFCEQPARLSLDDRALLAEFKPSYKHGAALPAPLALIGCVLAVMAWWQVGDWRWLAGAIAIVSPWPWTLLVIRPVNNALLGTPLADAGPTTRALVIRWGHLHLGRLTMGALATAFFLWATL